MPKVYTTEELIKILATERRACLNGQRLNLAAKTSGVNPLIDKFLKPEGIQKFTAYQDFKAAVHRYQREHNVSGIVWRQLTLKNKTLRIPEVDAQLIALPSDMETLKAAKNSIMLFWHEATAEMDLYLSVNNGKDHRMIMAPDVDRIACGTEWASLWKWEKSDFLEIVLQLGWGKPEEAAYKRGWPHSGSEYIHAVNPGNSPIC
ncbi:hypothetical protein NDI37_18155 [Funiculus sociatus GB2-A5]|uniref:Uncharacterized protein n=1 Tax=Funiculus sociatus GB2-A5 TaxID=2933946 RepID=A0ABV0JSF3_9CYAN|nr:MULTISPECIES: hypothetical protein [unclassified Trichocoleus]MBD1907439.1 hypothetical protein [Trichocoleus sp. FACHB-832]MBD2061121.1 hypothetical protein [Trichocoleus sp. FACHB-6]